MARVKLIMPEGTPKKYSIPVRITDLNYGNHLGNDSLITLIHEARVKWLVSGGFTEKSIDGAGLIMNELVANYLNESFYGDDLIFEIIPGDIGSIGFEIYYRVYTERRSEKIPIAIVKTGMVCFDYEKRKTTAIPESFLLFLKSHL
jgi:acyl-CoA thioesterase FadM